MSDLRRFKRFPGSRAIPVIIGLLCGIYLCQPAACTDLWTSLSIRFPKYGNKLDYEVKVGGSDYNNTWMYGWERENSEYFKMSDMRFLYSEFRWQFYMKEAYDQKFCEALWSTIIKPFGLRGLKSGGSLRTDMIIKETKYLAYLKYKQGNFSAEFYQNGIDYYSYELKFKGKVHKGMYPLIIYKDINGEKWGQAKIEYRFEIGEKKK